jgi:CPA2 family monovalent cation:H+ antiporter-2
VEATAPRILELGAILLLAAWAGWAARRVGVPAVLGYLGVGLAISPFTPGYVADREGLQLFADLGVVLLLFEVGIEVDLLRLRREHGRLIWAAPLQTVLTAAIVTVAATFVGLELFAAALVGLGTAMSSSVVVVNITRSRRRTTDARTDEALLGWSVLQDVTGVVLAIIVLAVAGHSERSPIESLVRLAAFAAVALLAAAALPRFLRRLREQHDLFLIVSVATGLAVAGLGAVLGDIPLALAAFIAGLAITESPDSAEARRRLLPFRDLLAVLFFVAIGTLIDPAALASGLPVVAGLVLAVGIAKSGVIYVLARGLRLSGNPAQLAVGLGQIGEFSFVLASVGHAAGAIDATLYAAILAAVVLTIAGSTVIVRLVRPRPLPPAAAQQGQPAQ